MLNTISVYVIEDQIAYRSELQKYISSLNSPNDDNNYKIIPIENFVDFHTDVKNLNIKDNDIFLIDIDLNLSFTGIDLAKLIRTKNDLCFIVFLTNLSDKGIDVINQNINATSYLLKGTTLDTVRVKKLFASIQSDIKARIHNEEGYLTLKKAGETIYLKYADILYIQTITGVRNMLMVKTINSEEIVDGTLNKLKKKIQSPFFYIGLRSFIINLSHISSLNYLLGLVIFDEGTELDVGEKIVYKLKKSL